MINKETLEKEMQTAYASYCNACSSDYWLDPEYPAKVPYRNELNRYLALCRQAKSAGYGWISQSTSSGYQITLYKLP